MTPRALIQKTAGHLRACGVPDPVTDCSLLLSSVCGVPPLELRIDDQTALTAEQLSCFIALAERREKREPLQYILSEAYFCGRPFHVEPVVLIPRPETELLCEWAADLLRLHSSPSILDLCTGSGCIGITLALDLPRADVTASDISPDAIRTARYNARRLGADVRFLLSDLYDSVETKNFSLVISNPPYIPSSEIPCLQPEVLFEPCLALDGGYDGLSFYRRIVSGSLLCLAPGGILLMELGYGQHEAVLQMMLSAGFSETEIRSDYSGIKRMIMGRL